MAFLNAMYSIFHTKIQLYYILLTTENYYPSDVANQDINNFLLYSWALSFFGFIFFFLNKQKPKHEKIKKTIVFLTTNISISLLFIFIVEVVKYIKYS